MRKRLTERTVEKLTLRPGDRIEIADTLVPGLRLRAGRSLASHQTILSWSLWYRVNGRAARMGLGRFPAISLADARKNARLALEHVENERDPRDIREERRREREAARREAETNSIEAVVSEFTTRAMMGRRPRHVYETKRILNTYVVPAWTGRSLASIEKNEVKRLIMKICEKRPYQGNRIHAAVRRLFSWAEDEGIIVASPVAGIKAPGKEHARDRVLTEDETADIWRAAERISYPYGQILRLLLLTGQRRGEVGNMRWEHVDLQAKVWRLPGSATKNGRPHEVPLSDAAVALLQTLPRIDSAEWVFSVSGEAPFDSYTKGKVRIDGLITKMRKERGEPEIEDWRVHDLRRTAASGLARLGVAPHVIEKIINHATGQIRGVAAIYNRFGYDAEKRLALDRWSTEIERILSGEPHSNVVAFTMTRQ